MTLPDLGDWLDEWSRLWKVPGLARKLQVVTNPRLRRSLGRCHPRSGRVQLHPRLADEPAAFVREVVCHEAAHAAVHLLHKARVRPHGHEWAQLMRLAGYEPRVRIDPAALSATLQEAMRPRKLYRHHCPVCGAARMARRRVHRWHCRTCREAGLSGRLEITHARESLKSL